MSNKRKYRALRGTVDVLPDIQPQWHHVREVMISVCERYGYGQINTPILEDYNLFVRGVGEVTDIVEKEMYVIKDKGGDELALRPEATASFCRAYLEHGMRNKPQPVRLFAVMAPMFRYSRPQAGRLRQFHQLNVEAIGDQDPITDAEIIGLCWQIFHELGLSDITIQLNSIGDGECRPNYVHALQSYYEQQLSQICVDCKKRMERNPLRLLDCKESRCQPVIEAAPRSTTYLCGNCENHFSHLTKCLNEMAVPFKLEHRLVRGLDYYTRTVFEVQTLAEGGQNALGGGGRYDGLIEELGGTSTPGMGFAIGIERVIINLIRQGIEIPKPPPPQIFIAHIGPNAKISAVALSTNLVRSGVANILGPAGKSLKGQLRQAGNIGVSYVAIIGEEETRRNIVTLRDMTQHDQIEVPIDYLPQHLSSKQT